MWTEVNDISNHPKKSKHACCTSQLKTKAHCPRCKVEAQSVSAKTLEYLLNRETKLALDTFEGYYYCKTASCPVIYFKDKQQLTQKDLSVTVGLKDGAVPDTLCYCFKWTKTAIKEELKEKGESRATEDISEKMSSLGCSCEVLNPSGRCCLKDVKEAIRSVKTQAL